MGWLFLILSCLAPLPSALQTAWHQRYVLFLEIDPALEPLPKQLRGAQCRPLRLLDYSLPVSNWIASDLERNRRLYGENSIRLRPRYIVLHFTVVPDAADVLAAFSRPTQLGVGNQKPVLSLVTVHYMVDKDGAVLKLVPEERRASGTYGLDHLALAIEMVAKDEKDLLSRPRQLLATFCLVDGLLKKYRLPLWSVLSHEEVALGNFFLSDYTDLADSEYPYFYPKPSFRYDPGHTTMAWCREFLLRKRGLWDLHPASALEGIRGSNPSGPVPFDFSWMSSKLKQSMP